MALGACAAEPDGRHLLAPEYLGVCRPQVIGPVRYVFAGVNACAPGVLPAARAEHAARIVSYRPFAFAKPGWAKATDWLGLPSAAGTCLASGIAVLALLLARRPA